MTIRLDHRDYAELKGEAAPEAPGHWRPVVRFNDVAHRLMTYLSRSVKPCGCVHLGGREWMECTRHASEAACEAYALDYCAQVSVTIGPGAAVWVPAEFFPDYSGGGA